MRRAPLLAALLLLACTAEEESFDAERTQAMSAATVTGDYFSFPWPDDRRLDPRGYFLGSEFPNPHQGGIFDVIRRKSDGLAHGWSLAAPIYLPFSRTLDTASLPTDPAAFMRDDAPFFLVPLVNTTAAYGRRVPLEWGYEESPTAWLPGHVLVVRPVRGFVMAPNSTYALVVTTRVKDAAGRSIGPDRAFFDATRGDGELVGDRAHYAPLATYLARESIPVSSVAGAAVFTTQDGLGELRRLRDWLEAQPAPKAGKIERDGIAAPEGTTLVRTSYDAPNFVHGLPVYSTDGGEFRYDADDQPIPARMESMRLSICLPKGPMPDKGFPVVFVSHGTGGDWRSYVADKTCERLAAKGIASFGIDNVIHGPRKGTATDCFGMSPEDCWLNPINPVASRNLLRQAALDHISLRRLVEGLVVPMTVAGGDTDVRFDLTHFGFFGHSQGGLTGALYLAIDKKAAGGMLSGAGGHLTTTVLERQDTNGLASSFRELIEQLVFNMKDEHLSQLHPASAFLQLMADVADPLVYADGWLVRPEGRRKHLLLINGMKDPNTPAACSVAYAANGGVPPQAEGYQRDTVLELAGLSPVSGPVRLNIPESGTLPAVTAAYLQFPEGDHFPAFDDERAVNAWVRFFDTLVHTGVAEVP